MFTQCCQLKGPKGLKGPKIYEKGRPCITLFQVCLSLKDGETRKREIRALEQAMKELSIPEGTVITLEEEEKIAFPSGKIHVIPAWKFLLA